MNLFDSLKEFIAHSRFPIDFIDDFEQYCYDMSLKKDVINIQDDYFFFAVNNQKDVIKISKSAEKIIGYSQLDLPLNEDIIIESKEDEITEFFQKKYKKTTPIFVKRLKVRHKDGRLIDIDTIGINSYSNDGKYVSKVGLGHNITKHLRSSKVIHDNFLKTIEALSIALEFRDPYTAGHMSNTAKLSVEMGKLFNFCEKRLEGLLLGSTIHDKGKIALPLKVLNKVEKLNFEDYNLIKEHPIKGVGIIENIDFTSPVKEMVEQHHERIDGSGYPFGLIDDEIILEAKIIAVADAFDAMTADRPYRKALSKNRALEIINEEKGITLCPNVVSKLNELNEKGYLDSYIDSK